METATSRARTASGLQCRRKGSEVEQQVTGAVRELVDAVKQTRQTRVGSQPIPQKFGAPALTFYPNYFPY